MALMEGSGDLKTKVIAVGNQKGRLRHPLEAHHTIADLIAALR